MNIDENTLLGDRYRVAKLLGRGGMGAVFLARDERFHDSPVAVKQTLVANDQDDLRRAFKREAMLLYHLRHPALPRVIDFFGHEDAEFLVMEFVPGEDLATMVSRRGGSFPVEQVVAWADKLLDVLSYLHTRKPPVIHRDIKPQNMKLTPDGEIVLLDFGLAKGSVGAQTTTDSVMAGTRHFAPPEQLGGQGTDERSDLYSLGATLYALLTATLPADSAHRSTCHVNGQPDPLTPLHELDPSIPAPVSYVLAQAMRMRMDERPATALVMRDKLRAALTTTMPGTVPLLSPLRNYATDETPIPTSAPSRPDGQTVRLTPTSFPAHGISQTTAPANERQQSTAERAAVTSMPYTPTVSTRPIVPAVSVASWEHAQSPAPGSGDWRMKAFAAISVGVILFLLVSAAAVAVVLFTNQSGQSASSSPSGSTSTPGTNGVTPPIETVRIPAGTFVMGSRNGQPVERPVHRVTISKPFLLGKFEVTQAQWKAVMGTEPNYAAKGDDQPVERVSWEECQMFIERLNSMTDGGWRLPTEAEWEYACRAGTTGNDAGDPGALGWYDKNSGMELHPVGTKQPNAWGLYDMHGNVWEFCADLYEDYTASEMKDPTGGTLGFSRVGRGGSALSSAALCRSTYRGAMKQAERFGDVGFRLARTVK